MHLRVDCIQCLCSQENHNLPCQCLQLSIKVFSAFFVCARRNGTGCPVLKAVSTTMGKCGPGPAVNARARRWRCWQSVVAGQRKLTETFLGKRVQVEDKVPAVQGSPSTEAKEKDAQDTSCSQDAAGRQRDIGDAVFHAQAGVSDTGGRRGSGRGHPPRGGMLRRGGVGIAVCPTHTMQWLRTWLSSSGRRPAR